LGGSVDIIVQHNGPSHGSSIIGLPALVELDVSLVSFPLLRPAESRRYVVAFKLNLGGMVLEVNMSDCETERQRIRQERWRDVILDRIGRDPWVTVYYSERTEFETVCFFSALIPNVKVPEVLGSSSWDLTIGEGVPGTITFYSGGEAETKYYRFGKDDGIEPLIIYRDFHGVMPSYVEISEEFRLFHNLFHDSKSNRYLGIDENGDSEEIALLDGESVKIKLNQIRSFLSRKEMHLAVFFDIREASRHTLEELGVQETSEQSRQDNRAC